MCPVDNARSFLVAGDFAWQFYEPDFCAGLRRAGAQVIEFRVGRFLGPGALPRRIQGKYVLGPGIALANAVLAATVLRARPGVVLAWRTAWLLPSTVRLCRRIGVKVVLYNNDDPFGPDRNLRIWRRFRRLIPEADACFAYRDVNVEEYLRHGARRVGLLRSWFSPDRHRPISITDSIRQRFGSDVVFVGHGEDDGRKDHLLRIAATGLKLRLFGTGWEPILRGTTLSKLLPTHRLLGEDYVAAIAAAKVALVFLSARNRDQYTRRCFEIPAIGTLMLAPRTPQLLAFYREGEEAAFYQSPRDTADQAIRMCTHDAERLRMAAAGHARCLSDGHDVVSRAREFIRELEPLWGLVPEGRP